MPNSTYDVKVLALPIKSGKTDKLIDYIVSSQTPRGVGV